MLSAIPRQRPMSRRNSGMSWSVHAPAGPEREAALIAKGLATVIARRAFAPPASHHSGPTLAAWHATAAMESGVRHQLLKTGNDLMRSRVTAILFVAPLLIAASVSGQSTTLLYNAALTGANVVGAAGSPDGFASATLTINAD